LNEWYQFQVLLLQKEKALLLNVNNFKAVSSLFTGKGTLLIALLKKRLGVLPCFDPKRFFFTEPLLTHN